MPTDFDWWDHRIIASQALIQHDGRVALGLTLDNGVNVAGLVDLYVIEQIRGQLAQCEAKLRSSNQSAQ